MTSEIFDWLSHRALALPGAEAVVSDGQSITYSELDTRATNVASGLRESGVRDGDRVAVLSPNSVELVELIHALPRLGAVLVPLNLRLTAEELAWQLKDAGVARLLTHRQSQPMATAAAAAAGIAAPLVMPVEGSAPLDAVSVHEPSDPHSIIYTSGTTGRPKGAVLTYGNFLASATGSAFNLGVVPDDRWLACMPLFHVGGLSIVLRSVIYGTCMVLAERFEEQEVARLMREERITLVSFVATMLRRLFAVDDAPASPSLRAALIGGGPVPEQLLRQASVLGYPVVQTYGLSETASQVATLSVGDALEHVGSAGKPLLTARLKVAAGIGLSGEILVSGPIVSPGYLRGGDIVPSADEEGWFHTGDVGVLDEDGFLYVLDRRDDLILSGGENVYPAEVEAALMAHPDVDRAAVVGLPDAEWGQVVAAALVAKGEATDEAIIAWARERLAGYKVPRRLVRVDELPETASGKVRRHVVREQLGG